MRQSCRRDSKRCVCGALGRCHARHPPPTLPHRPHYCASLVQAVAKADASAEERVEAVEARAAQRWEEREAKLLEGKERAVEEAVARQKAKVCAPRRCGAHSILLVP